MFDDGTAVLRCTGTCIYTHMYCVFKEPCVWLECIMWKNIHHMTHKSIIRTEQYVSSNQYCNQHHFVLWLWHHENQNLPTYIETVWGCYILQWFYGYRKQWSLLRQSATYMWHSCPAFWTIRSITQHKSYHINLWYMET